MPFQETTEILQVFETKTVTPKKIYRGMVDSKNFGKSQFRANL